MSWIKKGRRRLIAKHRHKALIVQKFKSKATGKIIDYGLFSAKNAAVVLPLTSEGKVVAIKQYRFGSFKNQTELPSGNLDGQESALKAAKRELSEETGYVPERMIDLSPKGGLFIDPPAFLARHFTFLALDCLKVGEQNLEPDEEISVRLIPLKEWIAMCFDGRIDDQTSLSMTFLALPHLKKFSVKITPPKKNSRD